MPDSLYWQNNTSSTPHSTYQSTPYTDPTNGVINWFNTNFKFDDGGIWNAAGSYQQNAVVTSAMDGFLYSWVPTTAGNTGSDPGAMTNGVLNNPTSKWAPARTPLRSTLVTRNPVSNYIYPAIDPNHQGEPLDTLTTVATGLTDPAFINYTVGGTFTNAILMSGKTMLPYGVGDNYAGGVATYNHYRGQWISNPTPAYQMNDIVLFAPAAGAAGVPTPTAPGYTFICGYGFTAGGAALPGATPPATYNASGYITVNPGWQLQPWSAQPTKTNVNTATFRELLRAFWCVMCGTPNDATPFGDIANAAGWNGEIYATTPANPWHQFRSPLRDPTANALAPNTSPPIAPRPTTGSPTYGSVTWMDSTNVMILRAALAAVNTIGLRDQTQDIVSRSVYLTANVNPTPATANTPSVPIPCQAMVYSSAASALH